MVGFADSPVFWETCEKLKRARIALHPIIDAFWRVPKPVLVRDKDGCVRSTNTSLFSWNFDMHFRYVPGSIVRMKLRRISSSTPVSQNAGDGRRTENIEHQIDDLEPCYAEVEPDDIQEIPCDGAEPNDQFSYPKVGGFRSSPSDSPSLAEESLTTTLPIGSDTNIPG